MNFDDDLARTDGVEMGEATEMPEADDYPVGMLASPTRIRL